jgi:NAD(P)H-hydrate epimerase
MIPIITPKIMLEEEHNWDIQDPIARIHTSSKALFESLMTLVTSFDHLLFIVGKGLNGADSLALALECIEAGFDVSVMCLYDQKDFKKETQYFYNKLIPFSCIKPFQCPEHGSYVLIDGVFGAGFRGPLTKDMKSYFEKINALPYFKIGIDIPSGIDGETGEAEIAIECDLTLSIGLPKWGLFVKKGRDHSGHVTHVEIGLKKQISHKKALGYFLIPEHLNLYQIKEKAFFHKYQRGQLLALASHQSYQGASFLLTKAAYRVGAGLVRLFHEKNSPFFTHLAPEVTQHELCDIGKFIDKQKVALVAGPGLVMSKETKEIMSQVLEKHIPCIFDGGALDALGPMKLNPHVVLTPHLDELKRVLKTETADFDELVKLASNHLLKSGLTLVIKGHHSWILHQDQKPIISAFGPLAMATAGSGDVLSGMIGGFLAKGLKPLHAAILGVGLHSLSGLIATQEKSKVAIMASDILEAIPEAFSEIN